MKWIALLGALWLFAGGCAGPEVTDEDIETTVPSASGVPFGGGPVNGVANLVEAVARPAVYSGDTVIGQGTVAQVVSERAFWLASEGNYIFTVIRGPEVVSARGDSEQISLKAGQVLQLSGELRSADELSKLGGEVDPYAARVAERQEFILLVSPNTLRIVTRGVARRSAKP